MRREEEELSRSGKFTIGIMIWSTAILAVDFSAMNVALPEIERSYDSNLSTAQWVLSIFILAFAVTIVTGGRIADIYGREHSFLVGGLIFGIASFAGGFAPSIGILIGARCVMALGAALMFPAVVGIIYETLPERSATLAGGIITGSFGIGQVMGPLIGGAFTDLLSWNWILYANLLFISMPLILFWRFVHLPPHTRGDDKIDYIGTLTLSTGLLALLVGLTQAPDWGWLDLRILGLFVLSAIMLAIFVIFEPRIGERALVPSSITSNRPFMIAAFGSAFLAPLLFAMLLYLTQLMEKSLQFSAFRAGFGLMPLLLSYIITSFLSGKMYDRLGAKPTVILGALALTIGSLLLALIPNDTTYAWLIPGMLFLGAGIGVYFSAITTAGLVAIDHSKAGLGGGILQMAKTAGGSIGITLTTVVFTIFSERTLPR